ncbi:DUF2800 domain-containing protein [Comamonas sp. SY3]|uniref:DUF2800 domain-containing protein n=1 Tax=Comamonas sp. SY3 TaxID=3243601 RepID=UPI003593AACE
MSKQHARLSPSSADRWTSCTASPAAQDGIPNENSDASRQGTTCHQIQEELLLNPELDPQSYLGRVLVFWQHPESDSRGETWAGKFSGPDYDELNIEAEVEVTEEMLAAVNSAVAFIREQHDLMGGQLLVEQRVPIGQFTGEEGAEGSADVILLGEDWIHVMDSKFGRKKVYARELDQPERVCFITGQITPETHKINRQMGCYALGAIFRHDIFGLVKTVHMTIVQPFVGHTDSYSCDIAELQALELFLKAKAEETRSNPRFKPSQSNCHFCRAKGNCAAQTGMALNAVFDGFGAETGGTLHAPHPVNLGSQYALVGFVRQWADSIEEATRRALENGEQVVRDDGLSYKLVPGRAGNREWTDEEAVAQQLKSWRLKNEEMYVFKLITPAMVEKLAKAKKPKKGQEQQPARIGPRQWGNLQQLIRQGETKSQIALSTDPRSAVNKTDGFEDVLSQDESFAALFGP